MPAGASIAEGPPACFARVVVFRQRNPRKAASGWTGWSHWPPRRV